MFGILGLVINNLKVLEKYLSNGVLHAPECFEITVAKQKTKICSRLVIAYQGGQNNGNAVSSNTNYQRIEL